MKKLWKALGIAALAAVVPVRVETDEETGTKTYQSLLWKLTVPPKKEANFEASLDLMEGVVTAPLMNAIAGKREAELFTDDPEEAVLYADQLRDLADEAQAAADEAQDIADEAQDIADEAQAAADEARDAADEAQAAADDADPYFS